MFLDIKDFFANIISKNIYLIFGEEDFLIDEQINKIQNYILKYPNSSYDSELIDTDTVPINKVAEICSTYPLICDRKFVIIKNFEKYLSGRASKKYEENFPLKKIIEDPPKFLNLIIISKIEKIKDLKKYTRNNELTETGISKLKEAKYPLDYIIKNHNWIEFSKIYENDYPNWIINKVKDYDKIIKPKAAQLLSMNVRASLRDLDSEIQKLILYINNKEEISEEDIYNLTGVTKEYNVFELQKSIANRDIKKCILILNKILSIDSQEMLIITILMKFFINMFKFIDLTKIANDENILSKEMGLQKWQLQEYKNCAKNYHPMEIENAIVLLTECDFKLKSANTNSLALLQNTFIEIMKSII